MSISAALEKIESAVTSFVSSASGLAGVMSELKDVLGVASVVANAVAPETGIGAAIDAVETVASAVSDAIPATEAAPAATCAGA